MKNGWIKIHRKIQEKGYYNKSSYIHLWLHLLLSANHESKEFMWNDKIILIKEGQFITGRDKLAKATGINRSSIERILNFLESEHQIEQQKTTKYRLITIVNWKEYQANDNKMSNKRATNEQQMSTNKNDKNDKNEKKKIAEPGSAEIVQIIDAFKEVNPSFNRWYGNKTQRASAKWLLDTFGLEETLLKIRYLPKINAIPFAPITTTPCQLQWNIGKIKAFFEQNRNKIINSKQTRVII